MVALFHPLNASPRGACPQHRVCLALDPCSSERGLWASGTGLPGSLLKMQNLRPYPRPSNQNLHLKNHPAWSVVSYCLRSTELENRCLLSVYDGPSVADTICLFLDLQFFFFLLFKKMFYGHTACRILVPWSDQGSNQLPPALGGWNLNHQPAREFPHWCAIFSKQLNSLGLSCLWTRSNRTKTILSRTLQNYGLPRWLRQ